MDDDEAGPEISLKNLINSQNNPGVESFVVMNDAGIAVKASSNLSTKIQGQQSVPNEKAAHYAANISFLLRKIKAGVKNHDDYEDENEVVSIRLRTHENEIIVVPAEKYTIIVIHCPFKKSEKKSKSSGKERKLGK